MKKIYLFIILLFLVNLSFGQNVGIGTPTPDYTLDVNGSLGINDAIYHNDDPDTWMGFPAPDTWELAVGGKEVTQVDAINSTFTINPNQNDIDFLIRGDGINALLYADTDDDYVGIGTNTPQHLMDIDGGNMLIRGDGINALMFADHSSNAIGIGTATPEHLVDIDNGNMLIRGDGINALMFADHSSNAIGIGTATPEHLVDIDNGNMLIRGDSINALLFVDHFDDRIGIGTDDPQTELHIVGTLKADTIEANHILLPNMQYGQIMVSANPFIGTTLFTPQINYSGFTNPPHIFITVHDIDNQIPSDEGKESYSYSVYNVTNTSATVRLEEPDRGPMRGDIIIYWMAIE